MSQQEYIRIDKAIDLAVLPERVWRALTEPAELAAWFRVRIDGRLEPGALIWMTSTLPSGLDVRFRVRIVEMTPPKRLVWQWHPGEVDPAVDYDKEPMTTVTFSVVPEAGGCRLEISETGFDQVSLTRRAKVFRANEIGWSSVAEALRSHVEVRR